MTDKYIKNTPEANFRDSLIKEYLRKTVRIEIDRPVGYIHQKEKYSLHYKINYGYIPGVLGGDGEELDVYLLGVTEPVTECECTIIAAIRRFDDCEDKLVGCVNGTSFTKEQIENTVHFQEQYYDSTVITSLNEI